MASVDELDLMMRSGLEALAPDAPADLEDIVVTRLARRKRRRMTRNAVAGVLMLLLVLGVAGLFAQHDGQRVHIERGPSGTKTDHDNGKGTKHDDSGNTQLPMRPGGVANDTNTGNGSQPGSGAVAPGGAPGTGTNADPSSGGVSEPNGGGRNVQPPPPTNSVPKLVVTLVPFDAALHLSQPSVPAGPVDIEFLNNGGPTKSAVLVGGYGISLHNAETARVTFGDREIVQFSVWAGGHAWFANLTVTPPPVAAPRSPDSANVVSITVYDDHLELPNRGSAEYGGSLYTTVASGGVTFEVTNAGTGTRTIQIDGINKSWRLRSGDHVSFTVSQFLSASVGRRTLHANGGSASESLLFGLG